MNEIINFHFKKTEALRSAVEEADARVDKHQAELGWLKHNGASLAELVKASMRVEEALFDHQRREAALARHCSAKGVETNMMVCESA